MVRVLCCHHFAGQDVFNTDHEPLTLCTSGQWLFIASVQCCIHVHDLNQQGCPCILHMPTIAVPRQILHCQKGNYIAAIEEKTTRHSSTAVVSVRLYLQWEKASSNVPMKMTFAGHPIKPGKSDGLEIIEIPMLSHDPVFISCCSVTGNLAVAVNKLVKIYELVEHRNEQGVAYLDVEPLLDVRFSMVLKQVALCEEFVAVSSKSEVHVVRLHDRDLPLLSKKSSDLNKEELSSSIEKQIKEGLEDTIKRDHDFVAWDCSEKDDTILLDSKKVMDSKSVNMDVEILGPTGQEILDHPITIWYDGFVMQEGTVTTHLYRRFTLSDDQDYLHSLQFVWLYSKDGKPHDPSSANGVLQSSNRSNLIGLCVFCSTTGVGYLYNVLNTSELLATYPYTTQADQVVVTNGLIYAVTKTGLEVYTSRGYSKAIHNCYTYDNITETFPPTSLEPCLIGMQPFMVVQCLSVTDEHLVLMSKVASAKSSRVNSSIYALKNCKPQELVKDMTSLGSKHHQSSPPAYLQLLQEAQLCIHGYVLEHGDSNKEITTVYSELCAMLGDYYARCDSVEEMRLTLPYYLMTKYSIQQLISRLSEQQTTKQSLTVSPKGVASLYNPGLIHYLDYMLFEMPISSELEAVYADKIIDVYEVLNPEALPDIVLKSSLNGYTQEKAISALQGIEKARSPKVSLALTVVYLKDGNFTGAESTLFNIQEKDLVAVCLENTHLLHTDFKELTPLSQLIKRHKPGAFTTVWNNMYTQRLMTLDEIISLLQLSNQAKEANTNYHLILFLESLLVNDQECDDLTTEVADLLCCIYFQRLKESPDKTSRSSIVSSSKTFLMRYSWLNELPPFNGDIPSNKCIHVKGNIKMSRSPSIPKLMPQSAPSWQDGQVLCSCWICHEDFVKLQSVLSANLASQFAVERLLNMITTSDIYGVESLEILCTLALSSDRAVELVVDKHPDILVKFVCETLTSASSISQWSHLVECLSSLLRETKSKDTASLSYKLYVGAFKAIILYMSETLPSSQFFSLLPTDVSVSAILPSLKRSIHKHLAVKLKAEMKSSD